MPTSLFGMRGSVSCILRHSGDSMVNAALQQPPIDSGPNWGRHPTSYNSQHDESGVAQRGAARFLRRNSEASICRDAYRECSVGWWIPMPGEYRPAQEVAGVPRKTSPVCNRPERNQSGHATDGPDCSGRWIVFAVATAYSRLRAVHLRGS